MGLLTGRASGNIFVIDLDDYKDTGARAWWLSVSDEHNNGMEPETCQQVTGGGGRQLSSCAADMAGADEQNTHCVDIRGQAGSPCCPRLTTPLARRTHGRRAVRRGNAKVLEAPGWLLQAVLELVERHGGDQHRQYEAWARHSTPSPAEDFNAFGARVMGAITTCAT